MTMDDDLRNLARRAAEPPGRPPPAARGPRLDLIRGRVRRRRTLQQAVAVSLVLLVVAVVHLRPSTPVTLDVVDVGLDTAGLRTVDFDDPFLPTLLPTDYDLCTPTAQVDTRAITEFCSDDGALTLATGDHDALPESGEEFAMGSRTGYLTNGPDLISVTVSDATRADDTHYRLSTSDPGVSPGQLAAIIASVPAYADAVSTPLP